VIPLHVGPSTEIDGQCPTSVMRNRRRYADRPQYASGMPSLTRDVCDNGSSSLTDPFRRGARSGSRAARRQPLRSLLRTMSLEQDRLILARRGRMGHRKQNLDSRNQSPAFQPPQGTSSVLCWDCWQNAIVMTLRFQSHRDGNAGVLSRPISWMLEWVCRFFRCQGADTKRAV
jgi:hypothetical protein